jgi:hypothetical protein
MYRLICTVGFCAFAFTLFQPRNLFVAPAAAPTGYKAVLPLGMQRAPVMQSFMDPLDFPVQQTAPVADAGDHIAAFFYFSFWLLLDTLPMITIIYLIVEAARSHLKQRPGERTVVTTNGLQLVPSGPELSADIWHFASSPSDCPDEVCYYDNNAWKCADGADVMRAYSQAVN